MYYYMLLCTLTCRTSKYSPPRRIIPYEPEKLPSLFLEQCVSAVGHSISQQRPGFLPHRSSLPNGPVLHRITAQPPSPIHPRVLAPLSPPSPLLAQRSHRHPGLRLPPGPPCTTCTERTLTPVTALCSCPQCGRIDFLQPRFPHLEPRHVISARASRAARHGPELSQRRALI